MAALLRTVVRAANPDTKGSAPIKPKNTLHTTEDAKRRAGPRGNRASRSTFHVMHHANQDDLVTILLGHIRSGIDIGIMIYNTHWFNIHASVEAMRAETMRAFEDKQST